MASITPPPIAKALSEIVKQWFSSHLASTSASLNPFETNMFEAKMPRNMPRILDLMGTVSTCPMTDPASTKSPI